jgi:hypothetical protein
MLGHLRFEMCSDVVMFWDGCCTQVWNLLIWIDYLHIKQNFH